MINLREKTKEICKTLRKEGFKGIRFDGVEHGDFDELGDFDGDQAAFDAHRRDHGSFIAFPRFPVFDYQEDEYTEGPSFDESKFVKHLLAWVKEQVGEGVVVNYQSGCGEFECYRSKNANA